jgi:hypothetical protein
LTSEQYNYAPGAREIIYCNKETGLLPIPDVANRARLEMGISVNAVGGDEEYFDTKKYTVVYDAVVLSKLALLNQDGVKQLIEQAGLDSSQYTIDVDNIERI